ncbi:MAG: thioredoxin domain-containing protein [Oligoflexia bacterium]|nr:thioredoxin domain-containing protein [Oligoflexia bacterium]
MKTTRHNKLHQEKSPYLLQHKDNPVWWLPWDKEAFEIAKTQNLPIFLSIGYSTCHWCHVMEKDSFEKTDVAEILNANFVAIKVDREERPDVDSIYMSAAQAMTGHGGWPLSVLLTPEGKPFWAGTFVAHASFTQLLSKVSTMWKEQSDSLISDGNRLAEFIKQNSSLPLIDNHNVSEKYLHDFLKKYQSRFDSVYGGNIGSPKFPPTYSLMTLLRIHRRTQNPEALNMVETTLKQMRRGGIFDQIGGGFARYATDDQWLIPHFEKMLYDNALIASTYLEAYQVTKNEEFARTAREICDYVLRDMTDSTGGFYSAEDADSEHIEGKFYVWSIDELKNILSSSEFELIEKTFHITEKGNFHAHKTGDEVTEQRFEKPALEGNVLFLDPQSPLPSQKDEILNSALAKMLEVRTKRIRPHLDDKILVSWNGLMISALAKYFQVLDDAKYLDAAKKAALFLINNMSDKQGKLKRSYRQGESRQYALSDDYALLIQALLDLYECDFDKVWFDHAMRLQKTQDELFWDKNANGYFDNDGSDPYLITRSKTFEDGVTPSANSISALNLLRLGDLNQNFEYKKRAEQIIHAAGFLLKEHPQAVTALLHAIDRLTDGSFEIALIGDSTNPSFKCFLNSIRKNFHPNKVIADSNSKVQLALNKTQINNEPTFYICQNQTCQLPVTDQHQALEQLKPKTYTLT